MPRTLRWMLTGIIGAIVLIPFSGSLHAQAMTLQNSASSSADEINAQITQLQAQIAQLQSELNGTTQQKQSLQSAIEALNLNIEKITKSIALTKAQIIQTNLQIRILSNTISTTTNNMTQAQAAVVQSLEELNALGQEPLVFTLLSGGTLSSFFDEENALASVRSTLEDQIQGLSIFKSNLQNSKSAAQERQSELTALKGNLSQQEQGLLIARASQTQLLAETNDQQSAYEALIAQKVSQETEFEQSLLTEGSQLNLQVNPATLPPPGPVLAWPLQDITITQYFGNTPFATANPSIYNGHGHDGIDIAASPGTPVMAALAGVVLGTGNTDIACPGASFGKWIFIQHDDGLSTMYAHLAAILVTAGEQVTTGQIIAYSDTTGYATGPHLHFGVYATAGSEIKSWPTANPRPRCKGNIWTMPVATLSAYLNPLTYLPPIPK